MPSTQHLLRLTVSTALLLPLAVLAAGDPNEVLVAVQPASQSLTRAKQARIVDFIEWVFEAPLTEAQRAHMGDIITRDWSDPTEREGLQGWLDGAAETDQFPAEQRPLVRAKLLEVALPAMRNEAKTDEDARWLMGLYDAAHKPLAPGKPPLTRQAVEATVEMLSFSLGKAHGIDATPTKADVDEAVKNMVAAWPKLSADQKAEVASAPMKYADLRAAWDAASAADREEVAAGWRQAFPLPQSKPSPFDTTLGQRRALIALKEVDTYLARDPGQWQPQELRRLSGELNAAAAQLRTEKGLGALAEQVAAAEAALNRVANEKQAAAAVAAAAQARAQTARAQQSSSSSSSAAASLQMMQAHSNQMRFMEQMRQSQFNMIQNLGNNPYRYGR